jgi:membrane protease YdiL (CAAX protease family)
MLYIPGNLKIGKLTISYSVIISTLLFSLAHIGINYNTLSIESINYMQLIFTFGLGMFYAVMREKSGSLLGPIIAHGISDGSITVIQLVL